MSLVCVTCVCTSRAQIGCGRSTISQPDFGQSPLLSLVPGSVGGAPPTPRRTSHQATCPGRSTGYDRTWYQSGVRRRAPPPILCSSPLCPMRNSAIRFLRFHRVAGIPRPLSRGDRTCAPCAMHWTSIRTGSLMGLHQFLILPLRKSLHLAWFMLLLTDTFSS